MNELALLTGAGLGVTDPLYVDDCFATTLYTGNGQTQTINNGIDLVGKGGLVWQKPRSGTYGTSDHNVFDTLRGATNTLQTNSTSAAFTNGSGLTAFNSGGFSLGSSLGINGSSTSFVSWTFRRAPKFFDCGTYTGDGNVGRQITHSLSTNLGMVIIKATSTTGSWQVLHRGSNGDSDIKYGTLETTSALNTTGSAGWNAYFNATTFKPGIWSMNASGVSYVWYAFAHDTSTDGIIQCGSFTTDGSGGATVSTLGWEPQFLLIKRTVGVASWAMFDSMRGLTASASDALLYPNLSNAESVGDYMTPTANGFVMPPGVFSGTSGETFIYLAIRRPNKPPTTGTQVYNAIARTGTGAAATVTGVGFAPDLAVIQNRDGAMSFPCVFLDKLRGTGEFSQVTTSAATASTTLMSSFDMAGVTLAADGAYGAVNYNTKTYINHFFKRAPGVFDVVCYTGTGNIQTVPHSLGVAPEIVITKTRSGPSNANWYVTWFANLATGQIKGTLNNIYQLSISGGGQSTSTTTTFYEGSNPAASWVGVVAYLFATKPGISKVGSYTGNGSSQTIDMGFSAGCRFFLVKATSTTGNWWVYDSVRGIVSTTDFVLALNSTAAEVTSTDSVDPTSVGIIVNQEATCSINSNGVTYIYLAYA